MDQAKKDNIIEVAGKFFGQLGFKKTSVDEIAKACGIAKGTIYLACKSKEDLLYQVILNQSHKVNQDYFKLIDPNIPANELLIRLSEAAIANLQRYPLLKDILFGKFKRHLPKLHDKLHEIRRINLLPIREILALGIRQEIFKQDLDIEMVGEILLDIHMATILFHTNENFEVRELERRKKAVFTTFFSGIMK